MDLQNGCLSTTTAKEAAAEDERIAGVRFEVNIDNSQYLRPMRMHYQRKGKQLNWDMAVEHDNVAIVIFHSEWKKLLLVKQFRPPVFIHTVRTRTENKGKMLEEIEWSQYPIHYGETLELCAGLMDKPNKTPLEHAQEEIEEECGYRVPDKKIEFIKRYVTGISISGAAQHLFYAQIDETMRVGEGGGNVHEGEFIKKIFLSIDETKDMVREPNIVAPPSMLFGLTWWLSGNGEI